MPRSGSPKTTTRPAGGKSSPAAALRRVDLPQPDGPTMARKVPSAMSKAMSRATVCTSPEGARKRMVTSSNETAAAVTAVAPTAALRPLPPPSPRRGEGGCSSVVALLLFLDAELLVRLLRELVGVGLGNVDMRVLDRRHRLAEDVEHRLGALGVHQAVGRVGRDHVLQRGEIDLGMRGGELLRHLRHDLLGAVRVDPL